MNPQYEHSQKYLLQMGMFLVVVGFIGTGWLIFSRHTPTYDKTQELTSTITVPSSVPTPTLAPLGSFSFLQNGNNTVGSVVTITIIGSSGGVPITAFDILAKYNPFVYEVMNVSSARPDLQVTAFKKEGFISITATKQLGNKTSLVLDSSPVVAIQLKIKQVQPRPPFDIIPFEEAERTKFVDGSSKVYSPVIKN